MNVNQTFLDKLDLLLVGQYKWSPMSAWRAPHPAKQRGTVVGVKDVNNDELGIFNRFWQKVGWRMDAMAVGE